MAFKLNISPTIKYPVNFTYVDANGITRPHRVEFDFKRVPREDFDQYKAQSNGDDEVLTGPQALDSDITWLMTFVLGWHSVEMPSGTDFNEVTFREFINNVPQIGLLLYKAFIEANTGGAVPKN